MPYMPQYVKDQRKTLVEEIVKDMQDGKVFMWDKGFTSSQAVNAVTNKPYRGGNVIRLGYSAYKNGFKDRRWMTFKQAQDKGYKIKKGSKGTSIEYFDVKELVPEQVASKTKDGKEVELEPRNIAFVKTYVVFNGEQIEGLPPDDELNNNKDKLRSDDMELLLQKSEAKIYFDQMNQNFYSQTLDEIHIVPRERFDDNSHFCGTAAHEIVHSTGHKNRLNRDMEGKFGSEKYAREELVAELTTMYMAGEYGFSVDEKHRENHKAYIVSWSKALKENPDELFRAARLADKALDYINTKMLGKNLEQEQKNELKPEKNQNAEKGMEQFGETVKEQTADKEKTAKSIESNVKEQAVQAKESKPKTRTRSKSKGREKSLAM